MARINNMTVPFNEDGFRENEYYDNGPDNGATQCKGFAFRVYKKLWGSYTAGTAISSKITLEGSAYDFHNITLGSMINCSGPHSMIVIGISKYGVTVYDANWRDYEDGERNKIGVKYWPYSDFKSKFKSINSGQIAPVKE